MKKEKNLAGWVRDFFSQNSGVQTAGDNHHSFDHGAKNYIFVLSRSPISPDSRYQVQFCILVGLLMEFHISLPRTISITLDIMDLII